MFISSYTTIYFVAKQYFFECLYFSEYDMRMPLFVYWLRKGPAIKYVGNWWGAGGVTNMLHGLPRGIAPNKQSLS